MIEYFWASLMLTAIFGIIFISVLLELSILFIFKIFNPLIGIGVPLIVATILIVFFGFNLTNEMNHNYNELDNLCSDTIFVNSTYENGYCLASPDYAIPVMISYDGIMRKIAR